MSILLPSSLHHIHESLFLLVIRIFLASFLLDSIYGAGLFILFFTNLQITFQPYIFAILSIIHSVKFLIQISIILYIVIRWATRIYYLKEHQLVLRKGFIKTEEDSYELMHLRRVHLKQNILGKLFNYGDVHLLLATSGYQEEVKLKDIANPKRYEKVLRDYIEKIAKEAKETDAQIHVFQKVSRN